MRVYTILHNDIERVGVIERWIERNSFESIQLRPYAGEALPELEGDAIVVIMGGEQSVTDLESAPYLKDEIAFIQKANRHGVPIFGVCLGAQLISAAFGGSVFKGEEKEMGEYPIELNSAAEHNPLFADWPKSPSVFHWHFDQIDPPKGATVYASSAVCPVQAFSIGERVFGLQFHLELTHERAKALIEMFPGDLEDPGPYTKSRSEILDADFSAMNSLLLRLLDRWTLRLLTAAPGS